MPKFSKKSKKKLETCHSDIQKVFNQVIKHVDCTITEGIRSVERQEELVRTGFSQTMNSKHLPNDDGESEAIDAPPYPIDWQDKLRFALFAGYVLGTADNMKDNGDIDRTLVSGIDWDRDFNIKEHSFFDGPHFQLEDK